jgi:hypothetical protein
MTGASDGTHVDTTLDVYTHVPDRSVRATVEKAGGELFAIVDAPGRCAG